MDRLGGGGENMTNCFKVIKWSADSWKHKTLNLEPRDRPYSQHTDTESCLNNSEYSNINQDTSPSISSFLFLFSEQSQTHFAFFGRSVLMLSVKLLLSARTFWLFSQVLFARGEVVSVLFPHPTGRWFNSGRRHFRESIY